MKDNERFDERIKMLEEFISGKEYKPMKFRDLAMVLQVPKDERLILKEMLDRLIADGKIVLDSHNRYKLPGDDIRTGTFSGTQRGFGFVVLEGEEEDIFIPENATGSAMHGDKVMISVSSGQNGKRKEGRVINILERVKSEIVGTYEKSRNFGFVASALAISSLRCAP